MTFVHPWYFLFGLPLLIAAWRLLRYGHRSGVRFSAIARVRTPGFSWRSFVAALSPFVLLAGLAALVFAAARPLKDNGTEVTKHGVEAIAIMMTCDISGSMTALDLAPEGIQARYPVRQLQYGVAEISESEKKELEEHTRLSEVKRLFAAFVEKRPDDLIGLVTFAGHPLTRSPLTADHQALEKALEKVQIPETDRTTAISDGLAMAVARLKEAEPKTKIVILLSDGVPEGDAVISIEDAKQLAVDCGVKVYTIGVGTNKSGPVPAIGLVPRFSLRTRRQVLVPVVGLVGGGEGGTFDGAHLKEIAEATGGSYYDANDTNALEDALEEISRLETTPIEVEEHRQYKELFVIPLAVGTALVFLAVIASLLAARRMA